MKHGLGGATALALVFALSACGGGGGGGVNSTPAPAPSPTPTPVPTPNEDLVGPLTSEKFSTDSATATVSYDGSGGAKARSAANPALTISYDASSNAYTVEVEGRSQKFTSADKAPDGTYHKVSGGVTDDLAMTPTGASSGNTYKYVGAGFWQRQKATSGGGTDGSLDAFVYGVPTASPVRSGNAYYSVSLLGAMALPTRVVSLSGSGMLVGELESGQLVANGTLQFASDTGAFLDQGAFSARLALSSSANDLTGNIGLFGLGSQLSGPVNGAFFGPKSEEIGASFSASNSSGDVAVGTLLGRYDPSMAIVPFGELTVKKPFTAQYYGQRLGEAVQYDPTTGQFTIPAWAGSYLSNSSPSFRDSYSSFTLGPDQKQALQDLPNFTKYKGEVDGRTVNAEFYNYGAANSEIQLSYASFYRLEIAPATGMDTPDVRYQLYGQATPSALIPTTGTATYKGPIYGVGESPFSGDQMFQVTGQSTFAVDFGNGSGTGTLDMQLTSLTDSSVIPLTRTVNFASSVIGNGISTTGYFSYSFFGPHAEELGASFGFTEQFKFPTTLFTTSISGVTIAKKQ